MSQIDSPFFIGLHIAKLYGGGNFIYSNNILRNIKRIGLIFSLIFGFILISNTAAQAQNFRKNRRYDRYYNNDFRNQTEQIAQQYGYRDGLNDGADAAREVDHFHLQNCKIRATGKKAPTVMNRAMAIKISTNRLTSKPICKAIVTDLPVARTTAGDETGKNQISN